MRMLSALFSKDPEPGSIWAMNGDGKNPFGCQLHTVLEVKHGWVKYRVDGDDGKRLYVASTRTFWFKYFRERML